MAVVLTWITLAVTALVVLVLVVYLVAVALALTRANRSLVQLAGGLEVIESHSRPLPEQLTTINGALAALLGGLRSVDGHLVGIRRVFRA
jgi:uncharacterized protein YoxC